jgi:membrane protein YdbS with pleckstrin-like domain
MDDVFAPPGAGWQRVSPRLSTVRRVVLGVVAVVAVLVAAVLALSVTGLPGWFLPASLGVVALGCLVGWFWVGRVVRRWGYAERDEELWITQGAMVRRFVVVPYGRMQFVDVQAGPIEQLLGIAAVHLHTASPGTSAVIPGLEAAEAARLRDRLTALGESSAAGL